MKLTDIDDLLKYAEDLFEKTKKNRHAGVIYIYRNQLDYIYTAFKEQGHKIKSLEAEIERLNSVVSNSVSKMELDTCRSLNKALREDNVRLREEIEKLRSKI